MSRASLIASLLSISIVLTTTVSEARAAEPEGVFSLVGSLGGAVCRCTGYTAGELMPGFEATGGAFLTPSLALSGSMVFEMGVAVIDGAAPIPQGFFAVALDYALIEQTLFLTSRLGFGGGGPLGGPYGGLGPSAAVGARYVFGSTGSIKPTVGGQLRPSLVFWDGELRGGRFEVVAEGGFFVW